MNWLTEVSVPEWHGNGATVADHNSGDSTRLAADRLVLATTGIAANRLAAELGEQGGRARKIGDCAAPRQAPYAFYEGRRAALEIGQGHCGPGQAGTAPGAIPKVVMRVWPVESGGDLNHGPVSFGGQGSISGGKALYIRGVEVGWCPMRGTGGGVVESRSYSGVLRVWQGLVGEERPFAAAKPVTMLHGRML